MSPAAATTEPGDRDLVLTRLIDAPRETLYRAWTEPELLKRWFAPLPYTTPVAELDVRPGGASLIVMRGLWLASRNKDPFCRFAAAGLTIMFGVQSWINMAVNLRAMPAKGMTLPFISYGGSSLLALGLGMGFLVALTRKNLTIASESHALGTS